MLATKNDDREPDFISFIHSERFLGLFALIMSILFTIGWVILVINENRIEELNPNLIIPVHESEYRFELENVTWEKDEVSITKDYVCIAGWLIKPGEQVEKAAIKVVLKKSDSDMYYVLPTDLIERKDITESMDDGNDYTYCGFSVKIPYWDELDTDTDYEILAQYNLNSNERVYIPFHTTLKKKAEELKNAE